MTIPHNAFWFRRDLRLDDNRGFFHALSEGTPVIPVFIFDQDILNQLPKDDARVSFIHQTITEIQRQLNEVGSTLVVKYGTPEEVWEELTRTWNIKAVYTNHDYEPYAKTRDEALSKILEKKNIKFRTYKDHVIFEKKEILSKSQSPYTVFTPYSKTWKATLTEKDLVEYKTEKLFSSLFKSKPIVIPTLDEIGFSLSSIPFPPSDPNEAIIERYTEQRDFPAIEGTSRMGIHLRFGTVSIRKMARLAKGLNETYLNELIWREFYAQILGNFPHVVDGPFRSKYAAIPWRNDMEEFKKWCQGKTGYPMVDAGMRQLNQTGFMHNRVRMVVASFLTKHLLINWQLGEAYFAEKLLDFDLASNNGGWQWAAGCGTDAAPYFRVFNPESQMKKFDPKGKYVRKWVPEFGTPLYPRPIVEHKFARQRCLDVYKEALDQR